MGELKKIFNNVTNLEMIKFDWNITQYTLCHGGINNKKKKKLQNKINQINKFRKVINNTVS